MPIKFDPADISTWVPALQADNNPKLGGLVAYKITRLTFNKLSSSDWRVFLGSGALNAVLDILCDDYVGGYEWGDYCDSDSETGSKGGVTEYEYLRETFIVSSGFLLYDVSNFTHAYTQPYLTDHLVLLANILVYLSEDSGPGNGPLNRKNACRMRKLSNECPIMKSAVETLATRYVPFMHILQYTDTPSCLFYDTFSTRKYPGIGEERSQDLRDADWTLGDSLVKCHETLDDIAFAFSTDDDMYVLSLS